MKTKHHQQNRKTQQARRAARKAHAALLHPVSTGVTEPFYSTELCPQVPQYGTLRKLMGRHHQTFHPDNFSAEAIAWNHKFPLLTLSLILEPRFYE